MSVLGVRIIDLTIIVLQAGIWFAGFYGYTKLKSYAKLIHSDTDGKQVADLAKGLFLLVIWLPVASVVSTFLNYLATKHPSLLSTFDIINSYINLAFPLLGFIIIGRSARGLSELVRERSSFVVTNLLTVLNIYIGIIYYRLVATTSHRDTIYHMSIWLILATLVAPYVYMWSVGLRASYDIYNYRLKIEGTVYKKSWRFLALGIAWLIVTSIGFQYLTTLTARLSNLSIYWILALVYSLLLVLSVGFILVAIGARKLQKIEVV